MRLSKVFYDVPFQRSYGYIYIYTHVYIYMYIHMEDGTKTGVKQGVVIISSHTVFQETSGSKGDD